MPIEEYLQTVSLWPLVIRRRFDRLPTRSLTVMCLLQQSPVYIHIRGAFQNRLGKVRSRAQWIIDKVPGIPLLSLSLSLSLSRGIIRYAQLWCTAATIAYSAKSRVRWSRVLLQRDGACTLSFARNTYTRRIDEFAELDNGPRVLSAAVPLIPVA